MSERVIPLENNLGELRKGDAITVVLARSEKARPDFEEVVFDELMDEPRLPLGMTVVHADSITGFIPFAGSSVGVESIIVGEGEETRVIFHNSNVPFPFLPPFRNSVLSKKGEAENIQRKVELGLGSAHEVQRALRG